MDNNKPILGTTIYSFTNEWLRRMYTLDEEVQKVAELDLGPAVEIVGFPEHPGVPRRQRRVRATLPRAARPLRIDPQPAWGGTATSDATRSGA